MVDPVPTATDACATNESFITSRPEEVFKGPFSQMSKDIFLPKEVVEPVAAVECVQWMDVDGRMADNPNKNRSGYKGVRQRPWGKWCVVVWVDLEKTRNT